MPSFLNAMTRQIPSSSIHAATQKAEAYRREGKKVVIFSIGRPDFDTPAHIKEAAKAALDKGYVHYTPNMGILPLREAVAEHIKRQTGVSYDTKMLFINSPHNPTGAVLSKEELGQIADFAKANNLLVVSDEAYDRLLYDGLEHRSIASEPGMRDRTVILGSFSKTYSMTGWRIGYLAGPAEVIRGMALLQQSFVLSVNSFAQWGAVEAMTGPQDCVEEMRQQFDIRRKAMMEALSTIPNVSFAAPKGAFYIYLNHEKTGLDPVRFCTKLLDEYYVACVPGSEYGPYAGCNTRLSCATGLDDCLEGVDRIRKMVASL